VLYFFQIATSHLVPVELPSKMKIRNVCYFKFVLHVEQCLFIFINQMSLIVISLVLIFSVSIVVNFETDLYNKVELQSTDEAHNICFNAVLCNT